MSHNMTHKNNQQNYLQRSKKLCPQETQHNQQNNKQRDLQNSPQEDSL